MSVSPWTELKAQKTNMLAWSWGILSRRGRSIMICHTISGTANKVLTGQLFGEGQCWTEVHKERILWWMWTEGINAMVTVIIWLYSTTNKSTTLILIARVPLIAHCTTSTLLPMLQLFDAVTSNAQQCWQLHKHMLRSYPHSPQMQAAIVPHQACSTLITTCKCCQLSTLL